MRSIRCRSTVLAIGATLMGLAMSAGVSPAMVSAARLAPTSVTAAEGQLPTADTREAAMRVLEFVTAHPRPPHPGASAPRAEIERYAKLRLDWLRAFPFDAGVEQWGCTLSQVVHIWVPSTDAQPAHVDTAMVVDCQDAGAVPGLASILAPRAEIEDGGGGTAAPVATCADLREGHQCLTVFPVDQNDTSVDYTWNGTTSTVGRLRIEALPAIWPTACGVGTPVATGPVLPMKPGESTSLFTAPAPGTVRSGIWEEANASGSLSIRSVFCALEPAQPKR
jgi:hypothetical protein